MRDTRLFTPATPRRRRAAQAALAAALALGLGGCGGPGSTRQADDFHGSEWLQTGANRIANLSLRDNLQSIRRVQHTLYRRNPREWRKWAASEEEAGRRVWAAVMDGAPLPELRGVTGIEAIRMAFETGPQGFQGDRVAALVTGWGGLLRQANGNTWEQTLLDGVSAENAYRAARNIEISLWLLASRTGDDGQPLLLSTEISERGRNLVADRELSKVVARLDLMAAQADEKYRRAAMDFSHNWLLGSLGPLLAMVPR